MITIFFTNLLSPSNLYYNSHYEKILATGEIKCIDDEIPFEIPNSWSWERWGNLSQSIQYGYNAPALNNGDIRMVRISDIQNGEVLWKTVPFCNIDENEISTYLLNKNDILFARTGGTVGKSFLVKETPYPAIYAGYLIRTRYSDMLSAKYMKYFMESNLYWVQLKDGTIATAQPNCNGKTLGKMILPLPPLSEQNRIVSRIEELMVVIDKLEQSKIELDKLEFELQPQLKKSILQYAIQGNLVAQNPEDEPAGELLKRINEEKEQLIKDGKIKRDKNTSIIFKGDDNKYFEKKGNEVVCIDDEIPFEIPDSWEWARLGNCCTLIGGYAFKSHEIKSQFGHRVIRISDISDEGLTENNIVRYNGTLDLSKYKIIDNDILIAMTGGTVGKSMLFSSKSNDVLLLNQRVAIIRYNLILPQYIYAFIKSPYIKEIIDNAKNSTNDNISMADISDFLIPLPPLDEQKRIVKALDNVLASIMRN